MQYNNSTRLLSHGLPYLSPSSVRQASNKTIILSLLVLVLTTCLYWKSSTGVAAPFVGYRSRWEPPLLAQLRYAVNAASMIREGYAKWKDSQFQISRYDGDILVLSRKYLDDLHSRSSEELNPIHGLIRVRKCSSKAASPAHVKVTDHDVYYNFGGRYSGLTLLDKSDVGIRAFQNRIIPNLAKLCDDIVDELEYTLRADLPSCQEWTLVEIHPFFLRAVERVVHRVFVGLPLCRDPRWFDAAIRHADNVTMTQIAMRSVPSFFKPVLNLLLPWPWKYKAGVRAGKKVLIPEVRRRRELESSGVDYDKPNDLLQSMIDLSDPETEEGRDDFLAELMLTMTAIAGHSTAASGSQALFDLIYRPEYIPMLRDEALTALQSNDMHFNKKVLGDMRKMDSFLRESQRHNPLTLLVFLRVVTARNGITLQDGTHVPYGTQLAMPPESISSDSTLLADADCFNGLRYYEMRRQDPSQDNKHQYATADKTHLHFGYGKWACPGRFMASDVLKMLISLLLLRYDIRYPDGAKRPPNKYLHEFPILDIHTPLLMKRRDEMSAI